MSRFAAVWLVGCLVACSGSNGGGTSSTGTTGLFGTLGGTGGTTGTGAGAASTSSGTHGVTSAGSTGTAAAGTSGTNGGSGVAPHATLPQAVNVGGPLISTPNLAVVAWQDDPNISTLTTFFQSLVSSGTFLSELSQYGVTGLTLSTIAPATETIPTTFSDAQVRTDLLQAIAANPSVGDATLENQIFVFVIPTGTSFALTSGSTTDDLCTQLGGYHSFLLTPDGTPVVYAVVAECQLSAPYPTTPIDAATVFLTHEIAEAATDPQFFDLNAADNASMRPAYVYTSDLSWFLVLGQGELADLCAFPFSYFRDAAGFLEQHIWSNAAAAAGEDPCGNTPYFGVAPAAGVLQPLTISSLGSSATVSGVTLAVGSTMSIPLVFFSTGTQAPWGLEVYDAAAYAGRPANTTLSLSSDEGQNGTQVMLTVTVDEAGTIDNVTGLEGVILYAEGLSGQGGSVWPILIQSP